MDFPCLLDKKIGHRTLEWPSLFEWKVGERELLWASKCGHSNTYRETADGVVVAGDPSAGDLVAGEGGHQEPQDQGDQRGVGTGLPV